MTRNRERPKDPYGQPINFDGLHIERSEYADERVKAVEQDTPLEVAHRVRVSHLERLAARYGLPATIALVVVLRLLGIDLT